MSLGPDAQILAVLRSVDTPTICNAIEEVQGRRRGDGFTRVPMVCADPALPPIVGYARTAKVKGSAPADGPAAAQRKRRLDYYAYVALPPGPNLAVIEDVDTPPGIGAFWGEVNTSIHKGLGVGGCVTNGSFRDVGLIAPGFQIVGGSVMPSHAFVHVTEIDVPVSIFGMRVRPGDLVHADRHGAVVIEADVASRIVDGIELTTRKEAPVLRAARASGFTVEKLVQAWREAEDVQ